MFLAFGNIFDLDLHLHISHLQDASRAEKHR